MKKDENKQAFLDQNYYPFFKTERVLRFCFDNFEDNLLKNHSFFKEICLKLVTVYC